MDIYYNMQPAGADRVPGPLRERSIPRMKYSQDDLIEGPFDMVVELCLDRTRDIHVYPNVTKCTVKKRETKGHITKVVVETVANGDIPKPLRKIILPKMLTWIEYGTWDDEAKTYEYKVKTHYFSNITNIGGTFTYSEPEPGKTLRSLQAYIEVKMPVVGKIAEKKISEVQKENLIVDIAALKKEVKEKLAK